MAKISPAKKLDVEKIALLCQSPMEVPYSSSTQFWSYYPSADTVKRGEIDVRGEIDGY